MARLSLPVNIRFKILFWNELILLAGPRLRILLRYVDGLAGSGDHILTEKVQDLCAVCYDHSFFETINDDYVSVLSRTSHRTLHITVG
jgi:hypothetical protein